MAHIIAAASDSGVVSIIDLRSKKEVVNFNLPDYASVSSIAWNPDIVIYFSSLFFGIILFLGN